MPGPRTNPRVAWAIAATGTVTALVIYPREGHLLVGRHALDQIRRTTDWFDRYLRADS